jgi:hypothetical protein
VGIINLLRRLRMKDPAEGVAELLSVSENLSDDMADSRDSARLYLWAIGHAQATGRAAAQASTLTSAQPRSVTWAKSPYRGR